MKTKCKMALLAFGAAAFSLTVTTGLGQVFNASDVLHNRAVAASPRAKEEFPWLTRDASNARVSAQTAETRTELAQLEKHRALAMSPRMLEQFPELSRHVQTSGDSPQELVPLAVLKNRALAASPRMKEQYPWLAIHAGENWIEVAPVK